MSKDVFDMIILFLSMFYFLVGDIVFTIKYDNSYKEDKSIMFNKKQTIITVLYFLIGFIVFYLLGGIGTLILPIALIPLSVLVFIWYNKVNYRIRMIVVFSILFLFFLTGFIINLSNLKYLKHSATNIFGLILLGLVTLFLGYCVYYYITKKDITVEKDVYYDEEENEKKNNTNNKKTK